MPGSSLYHVVLRHNIHTRTAVAGGSDDIRPRRVYVCRNTRGDLLRGQILDEFVADSSPIILPTADVTTYSTGIRSYGVARVIY